MIFHPAIWQAVKLPQASLPLVKTKEAMALEEPREIAEYVGAARLNTYVQLAAVEVTAVVKLMVEAVYAPPEKTADDPVTGDRVPLVAAA